MRRRRTRTRQETKSSRSTSSTCFFLWCCSTPGVNTAGAGQQYTLLLHGAGIPIPSMEEPVPKLMALGPSKSIETRKDALSLKQRKRSQLTHPVAVAVVVEGEGGVALSKVQHERFGRTQASEHRRAAVGGLNLWLVAVFWACFRKCIFEKEGWTEGGESREYTKEPDKVNEGGERKYSSVHLMSACICVSECVSARHQDPGEGGRRVDRIKAWLKE